MSDGAAAPYKKSSSQKSFHFVAGLLSGLSTSILLQPADLLKTRIQQESRRSATPLLSALRTIAASPAPVRQLWRGTLPSAVRTGVGSALYFGGLDWLRGAMAKSSIGLVKTPITPGPPESVSKHPSSSSSVTTTTTATAAAVDKSRLSNTANLLTGAFARAAAGFAMMPVTVLKVRYESSLYNYPSLWAATRDVWAKNGWRGFFSGFGATAVRDAPYAGLYVLFYEAGKRRLKALMSTPAHEASSSSSSSNGAGESSVTINFVSGVFAAGLATALTNPFDAIKTRLQLRPERYGNMVRAGRRMLQEEGWRCMFDGLGLRMGRKGMSSALAWTVYEELVRRAEVRWLREREESLL